jgi:hypothetical protein
LDDRVIDFHGNTPLIYASGCLPQDMQFPQNL